MFAVGVPAQAVSGSPNVTLEFTHLSAWYVWTGGDKTGMAMTTGVQARGDLGASTGDVTVVIMTDASGLSTAAPVILTGAAWTTGPGVIDGANIVFTFVWSGTLDVNSNTGELRFSLSGVDTELNDTPAKVVSGVATSAGATGASISTTALRFTSRSETLPYP
jgi:hypothetical protein